MIPVSLVDRPRELDGMLTPRSVIRTRSILGLLRVVLADTISWVARGSDRRTRRRSMELATAARVDEPDKGTHVTSSGARRTPSGCHQ